MADITCSPSRASLIAGRGVTPQPVERPEPPSLWYALQVRECMKAIEDKGVIEVLQGRLQGQAVVPDLVRADFADIRDALLIGPRQENDFVRILTEDFRRIYEQGG